MGFYREFRQEVRLKYKPQPYKKKKFVVHKMDFKNPYFDDNETIRSD